MKRAGTPSPRWAFLSLYRIKNRDGSPYLTRFRILQTPWFGIYLHRIHTHDTDRDLHDHPWTFLSIVLLGGYVEERETFSWPDRDWKARKPLSFALRRATDPHRIVKLTRKPTWTLLFVGPRRRDWGFHTATGWVDWRTYLKGMDHVTMTDLVSRRRVLPVRRIASRVPFVLVLLACAAVALCTSLFFAKGI